MRCLKSKIHSWSNKCHKVGLKKNYYEFLFSLINIKKKFFYNHGLEVKFYMFKTGFLFLGWLISLSRLDDIYV